MMDNYPTIEDVCNIALGHIGEWFITDITRESETERLCRLHLPQVRRSLLRLHPWNFAIMRVELPLSARENVFGFTHRYALPNDYLQLLTIWEDKENLYKIDKFKVEGQAIVTNREAAYLEYVADVSCTEIWTTDFVECVTLKLASRIAPQLGAGHHKAADLNQQLEQVAIPRALTNNSWEDQSAENNPLEQQLADSLYLRHNYVDY